MSSTVLELNIATETVSLASHYENSTNINRLKLIHILYYTTE